MHSGPDSSNSTTRRALLALQDLRARLDVLERSSDEPIAIVGIGCRYPGAEGVAAFWQMLCQGSDPIGEVPPERWDTNHYYNPDPAAMGKTVGRWGGFLGNLDKFDAAFFDISPREAPHVDPRQRLMLEVGWEALEDAGIPPMSLGGSATGVFVAVLNNDYQDLLAQDNRQLQSYTGSGAANSIVANRLSYFLDLRGPSLALDTACSGSLVAIHLACRSLHSGEATLALAGGVGVNLLPDSDIVFSRMGTLSPDGRCKTFDSSANGIVRSEGAGLVVLKRLSGALADGDRVYAVIRGSATNHDGRSNGIMAPNGDAQAALLREAYAVAGVAPGSVQYVETHGTATRLGDPIEVGALADVLGANRPAGHTCVLGSVKSNIGHSEAAAGVAGVIKVALALRHRLLPPNLHFDTLNPLIDAPDFPIEIRQTLGPWPREAERLIAGVNSFGFGGTNAHIILEQAPVSPAPAAATDRPEARSSGQVAAGDGVWLLPLSARSREALPALARAYRDIVAQHDIAPGDLCYTASLRRSHLEHRMAVAFGSRHELLAQLDGLLAGEEASRELSTGVVDATPAAIFVFSGQGSHWLGMGRELLEHEPVFRARIEQVDRLLRLHAGWSLLDELRADETVSRLAEIDVVQPAIFALQVALAALWRSWGIQPAGVVGQSLGEVAAAHVAGALSLEDAVQVVFHRSRLLKRIAGKGRAAVVGLPPQQVEQLLADFDASVGLAGSSGPTSCIISGNPAALEQVLEHLDRQGIFCRLLENVDAAAHSPQMEPLKGELVAALAALRPARAEVPFYSTVTGAALDGTALDARYWARNLREPFRFADVAGKLIEAGHETFLEISPHPVLGGALRQNLVHLGREGSVLASLHRAEPERLALLATLGALYTRGFPLAWQTLASAGGSLVELPAYPWQRERYWLDQASAGPARPTKAGEHPLLGEYFRPALPAGQQFWQVELGAHTLHYLPDHRVQDAVVFPGAAYLEMALAAGQRALAQPAPGGDSHDTAVVLEDVAFERALILPPDETLNIQLVVSPLEPGAAGVAFYSRATSVDAQSERWTLHASGTVRGVVPQPDAHPATLHELQRSFGDNEAVAVEPYYQALAARGLRYGPAFRAIRQLWRRDGEALAEVALSPALAGEAAGYLVHPALLDAAFQAVVAAVPGGDNDATYLPQGVAGLRLLARPGARVWSYARLAPGSRAGAATLEADITLLSDGGPVAIVRGLRLQQLGAGGHTAKEPPELLYELSWQPRASATADGAAAVDGTGGWLIFADSSGVGRQLATLLEARGRRCILVHAAGGFHGSAEQREYWLDPGDSAGFERLFGEVLEAQPLAGVVDLWSLDAELAEAAGGAELRLAQLPGCSAARHIVRQLLNGPPGSSAAPRLWLVTSGAQPVVDRHVEPAQAPVWGFGRVVALEHPELWGGLVDLEPGAAGGAAELLAQELVAPDGEAQLAFRGRQRYVARFVHRSAADDVLRPFTLRPDGSYLVSGGLTGLGLLAARWLVQQGARRLILLGRTPLPPRSSWRRLPTHDPAAERVAAVLELESLGASVHLAAVDIADQAQLTDWLQQYRDQALPPIRGVVHSAGVINDRLLLRMDDAAFEAAFEPKVYGAWLLHRLTESEPLDFFVMFSSMTSLLGQLGQANYAAGNAFMDALAHYRRARGMPALSINWGPWAEVGLFAKLDLAERAALPGVAALSPRQGLATLGYLLERDTVQAAVMDADWHAAPETPLLAELRGAPATGAAEGTAASRSAQVAMLELLLAEPAQRTAMLEAQLRTAVARVLRLDAERLPLRKPLTTLGMDSIMAVELKNHLLATLGVSVAIVDLFTGSLAQLVEQIEFQLQHDGQLADVLAEVEKLSLDQVEQAIGRAADE